MRIVINVDIEITDIVVKKQEYSFNYIIMYNGEIEKEGHVWRNHQEEEMMEILLGGEAIKLALEQL